MLIEHRVADGTYIPAELECLPLGVRQRVDCGENLQTDRIGVLRASGKGESVHNMYKLKCSQDMLRMCAADPSDISARSTDLHATDSRTQLSINRKQVTPYLRTAPFQDSQPADPTAAVHA